MIHIIQHLLHYSMPGIQIYVIRILVICPVYAISSTVALGLGKYGAYAEISRDVYEAFVIYSFFNLILEYSGGETDCIYQIENEPQLRWPCPLCFLKPRPRDARLVSLSSHSSHLASPLLCPQIKEILSSWSSSVRDNQTYCGCD
jgi:hypothetical protein